MTKLDIPEWAVRMAVSHAIRKTDSGVVRSQLERLRDDPRERVGYTWEKIKSQAYRLAWGV